MTNMDYRERPDAENPHVRFFRKLIAVLALAFCATAFANVVITDDEPAEKNVSVPANTELEIRGDGLTANCTLSLAAGATVKFYKTATIAAAVTSLGDVTWTTDTSAVIGTVSGAYTAKADSGANIRADVPGLVSFIGGGVIESGVAAKGTATKSTLFINGNLQVTNKSFQVYCAEQFEQGHFTVANGGKWLHQGQKNALLNMDDKQTGDSVFEIGKDGEVSYGNNEHMVVGAKLSHLSKIYINGGTLSMTSADYTYFNQGGTGNSVLEIDNGGQLINVRRFLVHTTTGSCKFLLKNGTWKGYGSGNTYKTLFDVDSASRTGRTVDVEIGGAFTLDLSNYTNDAIDDSLDISKVKANWTCTPGSTLKLIGRPSKQSTFTFHGFDADGLNIAYEDDAHPIAARIEYDSAPADPLSLGVRYPIPAGCSVTAVGANGTPALKVSYLNVLDDACLRTGAWDGSGTFKGFSSYSAGALLSVNPAAAGTIYLSSRMQTAFDQVEVLSGRVLAATKARDDIDVKAGATIVYQDSEDAIALDSVGKTLYEKTTKSWSDPASGAETTWIPGANASVNVAANEGGIVGRIYMNKLTLSMSADHYWDRSDPKSGFDIGEGGVTFMDSHKFLLCSKYHKDLQVVCLTENQVWTNAAETGVAVLTAMDWDSSYWLPTFVAKPNVTEWRLGPRTEVWLGSPNNDFSSTTITVEEGSTIRLMKEKDAQLHAKKVVLDGADMAFGGTAPQWRTYTYGVNDTIDAAHVAPAIELKDGGSLTAAGGTVTYDLQTLTATGAGNKLTGAGTLAFAETAGTITLPTASDELEIGVAFTMSGDDPFVIHGAGALKVDASVVGATTHDYDLADGGTMTIVGEGDFSGGIRNARALTVAADGTVNISGAIVGFSGATIDVTSGTLVLPNKAAIPSGVKVNTTGAGGLMLVDATGFDPVNDMTGTKNFVTPSSLVITDVPRENEHIFVGDGQLLEIYGSGLRESSFVTLGHEARVVFRSTATIFSPMLSTGTVTFVTAPDAIGTVAGFYTAAPTGLTASVNFDSPGLLSFIGGGSILNGGVAANQDPVQSVELVRGNVQVTNEMFTVNAPLYAYAGHFTVKDGGKWWQDGRGAHLNMNQAQTDDVCVEVGKDGVYRLGNNDYLQIGYSETYESKLYINGGLFRRDQADYVLLKGKAVLEIDNGGIFASCSPLYCYNKSLTGNGKVILKDGMWDGNQYHSSCAATSLIGGSAGSVEVVIDGDFTIDQRAFKAENLANTDAGFSTWTALPGARLNLLGKEGVAKTFTMRAFEGDGLAVGFNANPNTTFVLEGATSDVVKLGYILPGLDGCSIQATGTSPALDVHYVAPEGTTLDASAFLSGDLPGTFSGFASVTWSDLVFDEGSTLQFPFFGATSTLLTVPGTVTLPSAMNYKVTSKGPHVTVSGVPVLTATEGILGDTSCIFTCKGGVSRKTASLEADGDSIDFSYEAKGMSIFLR